MSMSLLSPTPDKSVVQNLTTKNSDHFAISEKKDGLNGNEIKSQGKIYDQPNEFREDTFNPRASFRRPSLIMNNKNHEYSTVKEHFINRNIQQTTHVEKADVIGKTAHMLDVEDIAEYDYILKEAVAMVNEIESVRDEMNLLSVQNAILMDNLTIAGADL